MRARWIGSLWGLLIVMSGCSPKDAPPAPEPKVEEPPAAPAVAPPTAAASTAEAAAEAVKVYEGQCAVCHGESGKGDGEAAASLDPKPNDLTSNEWQASVTDDDIRKVIVRGGPAIGKAATMPGDPALDSKPEVVAELVKYVRGLAN